MKKFYLNKADNGYVWDKRFVWAAMLLIVGMFLYIAYENDFNFRYEFSTECLQENGCINPLHLEGFQASNLIRGDLKEDCTEEWCEAPVLAKGSYGKRSSKLYNNYFIISVGIIILALLLNHVVHNRGVKPEIRLPVKDKTWKHIKESIKEMDKDEKD